MIDTAAHHKHLPTRGSVSPQVELPTEKPSDLQDAEGADCDTSAMESAMELLRVASDMQTRLENFLAAYDLSCRRFLTLVLLSRYPEGTKSSFLADETGVSAPTMTVVVDKLVRDGLATKNTSSADRRATVVQITPPGSKLIAEILPSYMDRMNALMENVNESKRKKLRKTLQLINKGLAAV
jgi:DNA-binding MarR family transcriptional regulator